MDSDPAVADMDSDMSSDKDSDSSSDSEADMGSVAVQEFVYCSVQESHLKPDQDD